MDEEIKIPKETWYKKFKNKNPKTAKVIKKSIIASRLALPISGAVIGAATGIAMDLSLPQTCATMGISVIGGGLTGGTINEARTARKHKSQKELLKANEELKKREQEIIKVEEKNELLALILAVKNGTKLPKENEEIEKYQAENNQKTLPKEDEELEELKREVDKQNAEIENMILELNIKDQPPIQNQQNKSEKNTGDDDENSLLKFPINKKKDRSDYFSETINDLDGIQFNPFIPNAVDYSALSNINDTNSPSIFNNENMITTDSSGSRIKSTNPFCTGYC